jgi:two-component system, response regulator
MTDKYILLVEDNKDDQDLTIRALHKGNIKNKVVIVNDGEEALEYLFGTGRYQERDTVILPQIVLLDLKLPKIGGLEVLKQMRENEKTKTLPVTILTSSREETDLIEGYKRGANSFICKPVDIDQFIHAVQQLGLYWLVLNETPTFKK